MGLQFKRGTDSDRLFITPDAGEPIYTTDTKKLYVGDGVTTGGLLVSGTIGDSNAVQFIINEIVDSAYVQARQEDLVRDSAFVTDIVTSPYIQAAQKHYIDSALADYRFMDSGEVTSLIDSAYVQARQDFAYSSLTGAPTNVSSFTNDANYLDSTTVQGVVDATYINSLTEANIDSAALIAVVDSAYVQARQDFAYGSLTGTPTALSEFTNDTNYLDSTTVQGVVDASYIQANQITYNTSDFTDSTYVSDQITAAIDALVDNAPGTLDTLNEIAAALNDDDSAYATLVGLINDQLDSAEVIALINAAYVQARQITYNTSDFTDSAFVTGLPVSTFTNDTNYLDSTTVQGVIDATYIQSNQTTYSNVSEFTNDANYLDSTTVQGVVDAAYINSLTEANIDSAALIALVDSAYVQARQAPGTDSNAVISLITTTVDSAYVQAIQADIYRDSAFVTGIVDSAYINARVSTVDSGQVLNIVELAGYTTLDSANVLDILPDGTYRGLRSYEFTADSGDTVFTGVDDNGNTLAYNPQGVVVAINGILLREADYSINAGTTITLTTAADSGDEISIWNVVAGGIDSAAALDLVIDGTYRGLRTYTFTADSGDTIFSGTDNNGNTLTYSRQSIVVYANGILLVDSADYSLDGTSVTLLQAADSGDTITIHNIVAGGTDSALISQEILSLIDSDYVQARVAAGTDSATVTTIIGETVDSAYVQARQTAQDFAYSSLTGAPNVLDSANVSAIVGQGVGTTDSVTFASLTTTGNVVIGGDLQVDGTTTTVSTENLEVTDNMIYMNAGESAGSPTASIDVGWAANVNDDGSYYHVGMFRDADDNTFKIYEGYTPEPDAALQINTGHASFSLAPFAARTLTGQYLGFDSDIQTYGYSTYDSTNAAAQIEAYGYLTSAIDSTGVIALITANDQQRDSAFVTGIVDSAYIAARVAAGTDSATVVSIVEETVDSAYVSNRIPDGTYRGLRTYIFTADSGDTTFTGADDKGNTLLYSRPSLTVYANGILLIDSVDYTATDGVNIILTTQADSDDVIIAHNIVAGGTDSALINAEITSVVDSAYIAARVAAGTDSATVQAIIAEYGYTTFDSTNASGLITTAINNLVDGAPAALDTLNEIAAALNDDDSAYGTLVTLIGTKTDYDSTDAAAQIEAYGYLTSAIDSTGVIALITANDQQRDSAFVTGIVDSAYIAARTAAGTDSATVESIIQSLVDSAYVSLRAPGGDGGVTFKAFDFTADSDQTVFTGADDNGESLVFSAGQVQVYRNGILLIETSDYTTTGNHTVTLLDASAINDNVSVATFTATAGATVNAYDFFADSGQSVFSGTDIDGNTLSFSGKNILVHVNGLLLVDSNDYTIGTNQVTITGGLDSGDNVSIVAFDAVAVNFVDSAAVLGLIDSAYINARVIIPEAGVDSATVIDIITTDGFTKFDSDDTIGLVDSAYIQARQITYSNADFADSAYVSAAIDALIDGAPGTLDTLNEIAAALNDDDSAYATLVTLIGTKTDFDSADVRTTRWSDNERLTMGDGADLEIYHNGGNSFVRDLGTGNLVLDTNGISIVLTHSGNAEKMGEFFKNGAVDLYYNNDKKFETTDSGVGVTGNLLLNGESLDSAYIQARQITYDFLDSAEAVALITGSDLDMGTNKILYSNVYATTGDLPSASSYHGMFAHVHAEGAAYFAHAGSWVQLANNSDISTYGNNDVTLLVDSAYVQARQSAGTDSAATITLIESTVDSAYIQARQLSVGSGGLDSASVINLIDSDYVTARASATTQVGEVGVTTYRYTADSGDTTFSGADIFGNTLSYFDDAIQVYLNGVLLLDSADYTATNGTSIILTSAADANDQIAISSFVGGANHSVQTQLTSYEYIADSGDTIFSGLDRDGNTLAYTSGQVLVFLNGTLMVDGNDYAATSGSSIVFTEGVDSGDFVNVVKVTATGLLDPDYVAGVVDSAYIAARSAPGTDSATVEAIIRGLVDSDYVYARQSNTVGLIFETYSYTADSAQTVFSGADNSNQTMTYNVDDIQVFRNGILLVDSDDYTATNGTTVTLIDDANLGDNVSIAAFKSADQTIHMVDFEFTADSGQSEFIGNDNAGNSLSYNVGNILVHLNGILLTDSADYTAQNGTSITLIDGADSADILHIVSFSTSNDENNLWREVATTTYNAIANNKLIVDTSTSAVTVTLPASPVFGDEVKIIDGTGNAGTNNIVINRNSNKILGADADFTLDVNRAAIDLVYYNAAQGWIISGNT